MVRLRHIRYKFLSDMLDWDPLFHVCWSPDEAVTRNRWIINDPTMLQGEKSRQASRTPPYIDIRWSLWRIVSVGNRSELKCETCVMPSVTDFLDVDVPTYWNDCEIFVKVTIRAVIRYLETRLYLSTILTIYTKQCTAPIKPQYVLSEFNRNNACRSCHSGVCKQILLLASENRSPRCK